MMMIMMKVDVVRKEKEDNRVNNTLNLFFFGFNFPLHLFIVGWIQWKSGSEGKGEVAPKRLAYCKISQTKTKSAHSILVY